MFLIGQDHFAFGEIQSLFLRNGGSFSTKSGSSGVETFIARSLSGIFISRSLTGNKIRQGDKKVQKDECNLGY